MTYQHGLPFNQRVERKDKVKPSSPAGSANQKQTLQQSHVKADRVRHAAVLNTLLHKKKK